MRGCASSALLLLGGCSIVIGPATFSEPDAAVDGGPISADAGHDCVPERCDGFDNDCNGVPDNGADLACENAPQATSVACVLGACAVSTCSGEYRDCDGEFPNGCEERLGSLEHCLGCDDACGWSCRTQGCLDTRPLVVAGEAHACVVASDDRVYCWGANNASQLGDGTTMRRMSPVPVLGLPGGTPSAVAAGTGHTCAVVNGTAYCWGANASGQLGDGTTMPRAGPVAVRNLAAGSVLSMVAGDRHTCALTVSGSVYCWGGNASGQLGDGSATDRPTPTAPALSGATAVTAGLDHTCAIASGGVLCWGRNFSGQLGDGTAMQRRSPVASGITSGATFVEAGSQHTCAVADGILYCWGENFSGQVGDGSTMDRPAPTRVETGAGAVMAVAAGDTHTCAINTSGDVSCWGDNPDGRLGDGTTTSRLQPVTLSGISAAAIAGGGGGNGTFGMTCATPTRGGVSCWGQNSNGQLGDGSMVPRLVPTSVLAPP